MTESRILVIDELQVYSLLHGKHATPVVDGVLPRINTVLTVVLPLLLEYRGLADFLLQGEAGRTYYAVAVLFQLR